MPPVLDPRSAGDGARASRVDKSERPAPSADGLDKLRTSLVQPREASLTPPLGPPASARSPRHSSAEEPGRAPADAGGARLWTASSRAAFGLAVVAPAVVAFFALRQAPFLTAPLGHAIRGDSPLASGVLAVVALVGAAALATRALGSSRSGAIIVATVGAVLLGIVMIIVTFGAGEAAELEMPPAAAGIVPLIAPIAPLALGFVALARARAVWLSRYERREAILFTALASLMLLVALELGPPGAVRSVTSPPANPAARTTHTP